MLRNFVTFFKTWCWPPWYVWFGKMDMRKCNMNFKWLHKKWKCHTNIIQCLYLTWTWKNGSTWMNEKKQLHLLLAFTGKLLHYIYSSKSYPNTMNHNPEMTIYLYHISCLVIFLLRIFYYWLINRIKSRSQKEWKSLILQKISFHLNKVGYYV